MKTEDIDTLIKRTEQKTELLIELKQSMIYETKLYHLVDIKMDRYNTIYDLINICDKKSIKSGNIDMIKSYIRLHNINISDIYLNNITLKL